MHSPSPALGEISLAPLKSANAECETAMFFLDSHHRFATKVGEQFNFTPQFTTPWKFNSSPLKIYRDPKGKARFPSIPTIFQGAMFAVQLRLRGPSQISTGDLPGVLKQKPPGFSLDSLWRAFGIGFIHGEGPWCRSPLKAWDCCIVKLYVDCLILEHAWQWWTH